MKMIKHPLLFILVLCLAACKKEDKAVTKPVEFTETTYLTLGSFDNTGRPDYLVSSDAISSDMLSYISSTLPEKSDLRMTHPEWLSSTATADIAITQQSDVFITFVAQGTAFADAIAFYTYPTNNPPAAPKDLQVVTYFFPNAGFNTTLRRGEKVKIGRFDAGTSVGFVLLQGAWNAAATPKLNNKTVHFCSNDVLNPEVDTRLKKHAVLINYASENKVLIGFEDLDRTSADCDHDFNDVVLYATVTQ
jgi:hypothetical protein